MKLFSIATVSIGFISGMFLTDSVIAGRMQCDQMGNCTLAPQGQQQRESEQKFERQQQTQSNPGLRPQQKKPETQQRQQPADTSRLRSEVEKLKDATYLRPNR